MKLKKPLFIVKAFWLNIKSDKAIDVGDKSSETLTLKKLFGKVHITIYNNFNSSDLANFLTLLKALKNLTTN